MDAMCARYVSVKSHRDLVTLFGVSELSAAELDERGVALPSYNVAPTQQVAIVIDQRDKATGAIARAAAAARWGLVPSWARQLKGTPLINARVESAATKASFRKAFAARRCVFPPWATTSGTPSMRVRIDRASRPTTCTRSATPR